MSKVPGEGDSVDPLSGGTGGGGDRGAVGAGGCWRSCLSELGRLLRIA